MFVVDDDQLQACSGVGRSTSRGVVAKVCAVTWRRMCKRHMNEANLKLAHLRQDLETKAEGKASSSNPGSDSRKPVRRRAQGSATKDRHIGSRDVGEGTNDDMTYRLWRPMPPRAQHFEFSSRRHNRLTRCTTRYRLDLFIGAVNTVFKTENKIS
jgi:hypothetical protein